MSTEIGDQSAVAFSRAFYRGLAFGQGYYQAFELGRTEIQLLQPGLDITLKGSILLTIFHNLRI